VIATAGLRVLAEARDLVARGWTQGADARAGDGAEVDPWDARATSWSLLGAIVAALEAEAAARDEIPLDELAAALSALADVIDADSLSAWNDDASRSQLEVLRTLESARVRYKPPWTPDSAFHPN
jgi:hypothetical protein